MNRQSAIAIEGYEAASSVFYNNATLLGIPLEAKEITL
jgi:hypothetical protein